MVKVFISHAHVDKPIARRVARRLAAYGIAAWMDERGLRKGEALEPGIIRAIDDADAVVIIATKAAARSKWVRKEIAHAKSHGQGASIYSFFVDDLKKHQLFATHLGIDAMDLHQIEQRIIELAGYLANSSTPSAVNLECLREALDLLKMEEPAVGLLIDGQLHGEGLPLQQAQSVVEVPFHVLDFALNALYDVAEGSSRNSVAYVVASLFHRTGAGGYVLERCLVDNRCPANAETTKTAMLAIAIGRVLDLSHLDEALRLLLISDPPDDQALVDFVRANNAVLSDRQWGIVIRLITYPVRGPKTFTQEVAFEVLKHKPDCEGVRLLMRRWITGGHFDGSDSAYEFAFFVGLMTEADEKRPGCSEGITRELIQHIRSLARSRDRAKVMTAIDHLCAAAKKQSPFTAEIARECRAALGTAEWDGWEHETELGIYVSAFVNSALKDQDWLGAFHEYQRTWEAVQKFEQIRKQVL